MAHHQSSITTVINQIEAQQVALGFSDAALCEAVGFERVNILSLIKQGVVKIPLGKVPAFAAALELDPAALLREAVRESDPALWQVIEEVLHPLRLSTAEVALVKHLRKLAGNRSVSPIVFDGNGVVALVVA